MEYNFREIEKKWHEYWIANKVYKVEKNADKPKYYVLDMFPYPSGAGLHVGHPLGYIILRTSLQQRSGPDPWLVLSRQNMLSLRWYSTVWLTRT